MTPADFGIAMMAPADGRETGRAVPIGFLDTTPAK
jgi:hypothetical protein